MAAASAIEVLGAETHNLQGIDCRIPHGRVTVVTGLSGAGKSSLAFDTVFAEGQRRFVESMSTYARQYLEQMEKPPVREVRNLLPPVALVARNAVRNARSTVGTITEIYDVLRLLFANLGRVECPEGHGAARAYTPEEVASAVADLAAGGAVVLVAPVARPAGDADGALRELVRQGFRRRWRKASFETLASDVVWKAAWDPLLLALGRFGPEAGLGRIAETVETAYGLAAGTVLAVTPERTLHFGRRLGCTACGRSFERPVPALFSFNSPLGACPQCQGFGRVIGIDRQRVIPQPGRSLAERPIAPWNTPAYEEHYEPLLAAARERGVPLDVPWSELPEADREWVWSGKGPFVNLNRFFAWLERRSYKVHMRVLLARYRAYDPCPRCGGARLVPEALQVRLAGETLPQITARSIEELRGWLAERPWTAREREVGGHLLEELAERVEVLHRVGLDYLTLDRQARTLSGGEAQRIHLAAALGSGLTSTLYVLDEPTVGLHPQDSARLLELLRSLAERGNTVLVVEHDRTLVRGADHIIDLGPGAGRDGGRVVAEGTPEEIVRQPDSLTGAFLRDRLPTGAREHLARYRRERGLPSVARRLARRPRVRVRGARAHNLRGFDVEFPLPALTVVTGVSGSGKSTLVENVLWGNYERGRGNVDAEPGACDGLDGLERVDGVTLVDQRPLGRSSRSNPLTYLKAYDELRRLFAATPEAQRRGISAGHFSFNLDRGRCADCQGTGWLEVDMQFMAPVTVRCDTCRGRRFRPEVLAVRYRGRDIHETLRMTVEEALVAFADRPGLVRRLRCLADVGLGYLELGQATSTLSGGEAQRLKLASFLGRRAAEAPHLFLFDEPTTGLHPADIDLLYGTLRRLVKRGDGVVVVEHSLELVARADWIVDLGPGGGVHGGELLFSGPLDVFLDTVESPTADALRSYLGEEKAPRPAAVERKRKRPRAGASRGGAAG